MCQSRHRAGSPSKAESRRVMIFLRIIIPLYLLFEHDLFGKPVSTFPDHALTRSICAEIMLEQEAQS
jgi:hypothetical protein